LKLSRKISALAVALLAPAGLAISAGPASASGPANDFDVCIFNDASGCNHSEYAAGTIIWNIVGLPTVTGAVFKPANAPDVVKVTFDAFTPGVSTRVDSVNRAVTASKGSRGFTFDIGQTYRIDRIKVTVCRHATTQSPPLVCSHPTSFNRP
jgi:hypothetical protein